MANLRALLFGEEDDSSLPKPSSMLWGDENSDDLFSDASSFTPSPKKKLSDILLEIDSPSSLQARKVKSEPTTALSDLSNLKLEEEEEEEEETIVSDMNSIMNDPLLNPLANTTSTQDTLNEATKKESIEPPSINEKNDSRLFEAFIVVGTSVSNSTSFTLLTTILKPEIIFSYPEKTSLPLKKISQFCFPDGIRAKRMECNASSMSEMLYGQQHLHNGSSSFVFLLTGNESKPLYGICVIKDEPIEELPEFVTSPTIQSSSKGKYITVAPRVYCIISQYPYFSLHYDVLYGIVAHEKLQRMSREFTSDANFDLVVKTDEIMDILSRYYNAILPDPGQNFFLSMPYEHKDLSFDIPKNGTSPLLARWCLISTFRTLSLSSILCIFAAILQETQIVFVSKNLGLLSTIILSIIPMIHPLEWQGLLVPILPQSLKETLNAPVPYICGVVDLSTSQVNQLVRNKALIVHIDVDALRIPRGFSELPEVTKLRDNLRGLHKYVFNSTEQIDNPYFTNHEYASTSDKIYNCFLKYSHWLLNNICTNFNHLTPNDFTGRDKVKNKFINRVNPTTVKFVRNFINSQSFNNYLDNYIRNKNKKQ